MKYKIRIKNPNKIFIIQNKPVRSPFEAIVNENELSLIKNRIKFYGISDSEYSITLIDKDNINKNNDYSYIPSQREIDRKKRSDKNLTEIPKVEHIEKVNVNNLNIIQKETKKDKKNDIPIPTSQKKRTEVHKDIEQIINKQLSEFKSSETKEIKIEELTSTSKSILEKFLTIEL